VGKIVIAGICAAAVLATPMAARGADLGLRGATPEPAAAAPWNWSGLYVGTHTGAAAGVTEFPESNQVVAQVASINAAHTIVAGLRSSSTTHLTRYRSGNRMIQSRSTMCQ